MTETPDDFSTFLISRTADERLLLVFVDHADPRSEPVAHLRCTREQAFALLTAIQRELIDRTV